MCQPATVNQEVKVHPFEKAGLGRAPFAFVAMRENVYSACPGHSQPGGTCDYCGTGIMYECVIESSDGKRFVVGSDCVRKTYDPKLVPLVESVERERKRDLARAARKRRLDAAIARATADLPGCREWVEANRQKLSGMRHPNDWMAKRGETLAGYLDWTLRVRGPVDAVAVVKSWQSKIES